MLFPLDVFPDFIACLIELLFAFFYCLIDFLAGALRRALLTTGQPREQAAHGQRCDDTLADFRRWYLLMQQAFILDGLVISRI